MRAISAVGDELDRLDCFFGLQGMKQEWVSTERFMREAAATGLFPGEVLIEKSDRKAGGRKPFGAESSGRPSADDHNAARGHRISYFLPCGGIGVDGEQNQ